MINAPRILIIDDDETILELAQIMFESITEHEVMVALGGVAGLAIFNQFPPHHFDIITLDLSMPDIDGIQLVRMLAEAQYLGAIAFMSAADRNVLNAVEGLAKEFKLTNLGSIIKPFKRATLEILIQQYQSLKQNVKRTFSLEQNIVTADDITYGLDHGQFHLAYQPKVSTTTKQLLAVECLCRWHHPTMGNISPTVFIPVAEQSGLIHKLTKFVIQLAFLEFAKIHAIDSSLEMSVNVSMNDLNDLTFPDFIHASAKTAALNPSLITLEVTESQLSEDVKSALEVLTRIKLMGMKLSIDDFGTGYSSLEKLKQLPFSELKVDRAFVAGVHNNEQLQGIFESNIYLAKKLRLKSVAEGVEYQEEWDFVVNSGCDIIQGFLVAKPMSMSELILWAPLWHKSVQ